MEEILGRPVEIGVNVGRDLMAADAPNQPA
jgi:hypothetical protein